MRLEILEYRSSTNSSFKNTLIFVHGAFHGAWCWEEYFMPFFSSKGFNCCALSFRGHGSSESIEKLHSYEINNYLEDLLQVANKFEKPPILIGHSMGGAVVQKMLYRYPNKIAGIILMSTVPPYGMKGDIWNVILHKYRSFWQMLCFNLERKVQFPRELLFSEEIPITKQDSYLECLQPESKLAIKSCMKRILPSKFQIKVPLLILGSKEDNFISYKTTEKVGGIYNVKPIILAKGGHDMMLEQNWEEYAEQVLTFLYTYFREGNKK